MPKGVAIAEDIREAIMADVRAGMSQNAAGKKHGVSASSVSRWIREEEHAKAVTPKKFVPKGRSPALTPMPVLALDLLVAERRQPREAKSVLMMPVPQQTPDMRVSESASVSSQASTPKWRPSWGYKGLGFDYEGTARFVIDRLYPTCHQMVWAFLKNTLREGGDLQVISPYHSKDGADYYYSIRVDAPSGAFYTAHLHGPLIGTKFTLQRAVVYHKSDSYEMLFVKRNPC